MLVPLINFSSSEEVNGYSSQGLLNVFFVFVTTDAGFMMECSNWSGSESLNLQFMVPKVGTL